MESSIRGPSSACPTEDDLIAYARQELVPDVVPGVELHLAACSSCSDTVAVLKTRLSTAGAAELPSGDDTRVYTTKSLSDESPADDVGDFVGDEVRFDMGVLAPSAREGALGRLGKYEVLSILGTGGMGVVFKAFDEELRRPVALKVLNRELSSSAMARRRFVRESRAAAAVNHPNVVTIHGVESHGDLPFIVMECVSGISLREHLRRQKLELLDALRVSSQIATGLAAAHLQGVIHRDIKPANILLEDGLSRVKITDFGLARAATDNVELTSRHRAVGTPAYMSPEQVRGAAIDARSDLFSLGCVMYAMFTGHSPFHGRSAIECSLRVVNEVSPPLDKAAPGVPRFLAEIVARLLEKDPDHRYQSAQEVVALLEGYVRTINQTATDEIPEIMGLRLPPAPDSRRARAWIAGSLAALAVMMLVVGLGVRFGGWFKRDQAQQGGGQETGPKFNASSNPVSKPNPAEEKWLTGEITVSQAGEAQFSSISEALQRAGPGARIVVLDKAVYADPIVLNSSDQWRGITLEARDGAILAANRGPVIQISGVAEVTLRGFQMQVGADQFGIEITGPCAGTRVENVRAERICDEGGRRNGLSLAFLYIHGGAMGTEESPIEIHGVDVRGGGVGFQIGDDSSDSGPFVPVKWVLVDECTVIGRGLTIGYQLNLVNALEHVTVTRSTFATGACGISFVAKQPHLVRELTVSHNTFHNVNSWFAWNVSSLAQDEVHFQMNLIARTPSAMHIFTNLSSARPWFVGNGWVPSDSPLDPPVLDLAQVMPDISFESEVPTHADFLRLKLSSWKAVPEGTELPGRYGVPYIRHDPP